jgi:hypothetical protein
VRYHRPKAQISETSPGFEKPFKAETMAEVIDHWVKTNSHERRPINVKELFEHLMHTYGYDGSYRSVLRFVRARYPRPKSASGGLSRLCRERSPKAIGARAQGIFSVL